MRELIYIGIDPGLTGGVAILYPEGDVHVMDLPTITYKTGKKTKNVSKKTGKKGDKTKTDYDGPALVKIFEQFALYHHDQDSDYDTIIVIEDVHAMHKDTGLTGFSLGRSKGVLEGIMWSLGLPIETVAPSQWKPKMVGVGADKEASRLRAQKLFPKAELPLKKHHGRAEALLIAEFYKRQRLGQEMPVFRRVKKTKKVRRKVSNG